MDFRIPLSLSPFSSFQLFSFFFFFLEVVDGTWCVYTTIRGKIYIWVFLFFLLLAIDWMGGEEERVSYFFEGTRRDLSTKRLIGEPRLSGYSFPSTVRINR